MSSKPELNASFRLFDDKKNEEEKFKPLFEIIESAKSIINQLDTQSISPLEYFSNFISTTDQLTKIKADIISYAESSLEMNYTLIYNIVYTMRLNRLCKVYLLSLVGNLICQKDISHIISILNEELIFLDEVDYPIVSFFAHYYCFTSFSESLKLCDMDIARQYYLNMIIEMNRLLNEMNKEGESDNKDIQNLHCLVIENINKVILLEGVNANIFKTKIFPRLINLVFDKEEGDYSEYILDWIISGLNFSYVVQNFSIVVDTMLKVVDKDSSMSKKLNNIIEKIISNYKSSKPEIQELILASIGSKIDKIFDTIINIMKKSKDIKSMEIKVYLEHIYSLITFIAIFIKNDVNSNSFNSILGMIDEYFKDQEQEKANLEAAKSKKEKDKNNNVQLITEEHIKIYEKIYLLLMKEKISLFNIKNILSIVEHFDNENKQKANYNLLVYLNTSEDNLDEENKIEFLVSIIKNSIYIKTEEVPNTEHEEITIGKLIERINNPNPEKYLKLLVIFKNIFEKNKFKLEITVDNFLTAILQLFSNVEENYHYILTKRENKDAEIDNTATVKMELTEYTDDKIMAFIKNLLTFIQDIISNDFGSFPKYTTKLVKSLIEKMDTIQFLRDFFMELCLECYSLYLKIVYHDVDDSSTKVDLVSELITVLSKSTILTKEKYLQVTNSIVKKSRGLQKRCETAKIMLVSCDLYYNPNFTDKKKIEKNLKEAEKESEFAMVKPENLNLFVILLEKMIFYYQNKEQFVSLEKIQKINNSIDKYLKDLKNINEEIATAIEGKMIGLKEIIKQFEEAEAQAKLSSNEEEEKQQEQEK